MVKDGYETMRLRRGKPARTYLGTSYLPGVPIDPTDPNIADPAFRMHLEPCRAEGSPPARPPIEEPLMPLFPANPAATFEAEDRDQDLDDEEDERN